MASESADITELLAALFQLKTELQPVQKDSENPHFKSKYASLEAVIDTAFPLLSKNNLLLVQEPDHILISTSDATRPPEIAPVLITTLYHLPSKQFKRSVMPLLPAQFNPQGQGSALTYARRYATTCILGIIQSDDDGNAGSNRGNDDDRQSSNKPRQQQNYNQHRQQQQNQQKQEKKQQEKPKPKVLVGTVMGAATHAGWKIPDAKKFLAEFFQMEFEKIAGNSSEESLLKAQEAILAAAPKKH